MAFASTGPLSISTVNAAYGTALRNFGFLNGQFTYGSSTDPTTAVKIEQTSGISLGSFRGKFVQSSGTIIDQNAFAQDGRAGHGVEARAGFNTVAVVYQGTIIKSISLNFYLNATGTGSYSSTGTNSPVIQIYGDDLVTPLLQEGSTGTKSVNLNSLKFKISVAGNASNNWGDQAGASGSWTYNLKSDGKGVTGP